MKAERAAQKAAQAARRAHRKDRPRTVRTNRNPPRLESEPDNEPSTGADSHVGPG